jgi:hypothetical protein
MSERKNGIGRRNFLSAGGALALTPLLGSGSALQAQAAPAKRPASTTTAGRRKLGRSKSPPSASASRI